LTRLVKRLFDLLLFALAAILAAVLLQLPPAPGALAELVQDRLSVSGVEHPVTAVLLNFRGYDTLLEMLVLLLALAAVRSMGTLPRHRSDEPPSPVLLELLRLLVPLLVLVAGYLLWVGKHAPGGAFQAGAVLGAAGVLLLLTDRGLGDAPREGLLRVLPVIGTACFALIAGGLAFIRGHFLGYPPASAGTLILVIEALATVSIAATLVLLFIGAPSDGGEQ
jgi:multisubunit Na+/H+ antiporter MnhB subunit